MAEDGKQPLRAVHGPYHRPENGKWQVNVKDLSGKLHNSSFSIESKAMEYAEKARSRIVAVDPTVPVDEDPLDIEIPDDGDGENQVGWYEKVGRVVLKAMLRCTDPSRRDVLRKDVATISGLQKGVKAILDQGKIEKRVAEVEAQLSEVRAKRQHGAGTRGTFRRNRTGTRPGKSVSGSGV